jgi:hypothetical protein
MNNELGFILILEPDEVGQNRKEDPDNCEHRGVFHKIGEDHQNQTANQGHSNFLLFSIQEIA